MITIARIDHVALRVADLDEAAARWGRQFGLHERDRDAGTVRLACDDEPYCLELIAGGEPGLDHVGWELAADCPLEQAAEHLRTHGASIEPAGTGPSGTSLRTTDPDGNGVEILAFREPASRLTPHARPPSAAPAGHPRRLGHVNFLTGAITAQLAFYTEVLGMRITDWLGDGGVWLYVNSDHHVMALIQKPSPPAPHFHHLALELVDIGQMRMALDHLGRHGRWLGWGPVRHGVGGNIAAYVRIVEEACFVELYCDMEQLPAGHTPRRWPDDRYSSNTWGPLPPRSYFRFDAAAIASERESLEMLGVPLPPAPEPTAVR
ncbi:MAG TPA: VOC family protein [Solirubrobacteraceae bacterium]|nr:VOC family protein [Solirubrobacteraceae bacterium]